MLTGTCYLRAFVIGVSNKGTWLYIHILVLVQIWIIKVSMGIYWFRRTRTCSILVVEFVQNKH